MTNILLVDFESLDTPNSLESSKRIIIEHVIRHPNSRIVVLNAIPSYNIANTRQDLRAKHFPVDSIISNPLDKNIPGIVFKTMFAVKFQDDDQSRLVLAIDNDQVARQMWKDSGVPHTFNPSYVPKHLANDTTPKEQAS